MLIISKSENKITQDNLILDDILDEKVTTFYLTFLDKSIKVTKKDYEAEDDWEFETNLSLTDLDKETIKLFCESQDNQ